SYEGLPAGAVVGGTLQMPSLAESGLKVKFPGDAQLALEGEQRIVLVDFDVSQSFGHAAGNSGDWVMHPVIHATDVSATGSVNVSLSLDEGVTLPQVNGADITLADFSAVLVNSEGGEETMALADEDEDGVFNAEYLLVMPGDYEIRFTAPDAAIQFTTDPETP